ncbi:ABC transporter ATP-binding protein [Leptospira bandrabouensis]|uniref:ABC transporter ATP-binding protein n=1 Tax=Leptospira bandrabouensis TaxID=2484903 RepID=UPI001EE9662B|nr:ABC transporter ATP-binding protein [Leptospira bandrabouensis]MCG6144810.1 ABC transporter ATP-binding protein [Leptospira bandrabouensis]MCG6160553.1 ABC transporter ATP-binding protein [Leptospira bandrabouensis]MCG6164485.1 ABC transporter ATP-binding protein [Leptospira bandrabouensis]MCW7458985.1 ABC transporter ATP-binding protein [Leptospira bandrabouensis]MCW7478053.1 ABC transporter ATP-binding protein [Leptospira bandrabouensis]
MQKYAIELEGLEKTYANGVKALRSINLKVESGDFFALLGPNGAGKSTTIGILSSLINKTGGKVRIFGTDIDSNPDLAKTYLGIVPQEFNFGIFEAVEQILINQAGFYGIPYKEAKGKVEYYLEKLSLIDKRKSAAGQLSGGMKRRLMIARALVHDPKLLILDEPTAGVDIEIRRSMWEFLKELNQAGKTIILTTHYLEEAESLCKNIAIIDKGEIVENTSMKKLLHRLDKETLIIDLKKSIKSKPISKKFTWEWLDDHTLEVQLDKKESVNQLFTELTKLKLDVLSLRNKSNRLEELFLSLTGKN